MVQVQVTTQITCDEILDKVWRDSYFSQNGTSPSRWLRVWNRGRPLKDHQLRNSVSAFNMYAFKTIGALPEDPRSHNKLLTQGWLRQRDLEYALHGTKNQVQRMMRANGLSLEAVAKPQRACALWGIVRGPYVRCSTPDGDGCGKKYCSECLPCGGLLPPPLQTPPRHLFTKKWAVTRLSFLCSQVCADGACRAEYVEQSYDTGMLTDAEIDAAADEAERALERRQEEWDMEQADLSYWEPDPNGYQSHVNALSELADQWEVMDNDTEMEDAVGS